MGQPGDELGLADPAQAGNDLTDNHRAGFLIHHDNGRLVRINF